MRATSNLQSAADRILIALFFVLLFLPLADSAFGLDPAPPVKENRPPMPFPPAPESLRELARLPAPFEDWFDDHFGFRNSLLRMHHSAVVRAFGVSPTPTVTIGKEGWLFLAEEELQYHRADRPFTSEELEAWRRTLEARRDWLEARDCRYLVVIAPNKSTIYPEYLPESARRLGPTCRLEQLLAYLASRSDVDVLDLRGPLLAAKAEAPLYFRTDTHWNSLGAFVGYEEMTRAIGRWFPAVTPAPRAQFRSRISASVALDLGQMIGVEQLFTETRVQFASNAPRRAQQVRADVPPGLVHAPLGRRLYATEVADPSLPRAVMFCDSFSTFYSVYLSEHFSRMVRFRSSYQVDPPAVFEPALIEAERPQVVISEFAERFLVREPPPPPPLDVPRR